MPSLVKFLVIIIILAGAGIAALWSLAYLVEPQPRETTITIPQDRLGK
jgi:hypothetical protein